MKLKFPLFVGLLVLASCANQAQPFTIANFYPMAPGCDGISNGGDLITLNGYLDVAAGGAQFFTGVHIIGGENIQQNEVAVGSTILERANRNSPVINQMVVTYRLSRSVGGTPKPYLTNFSLPFSDNGEIFAPVQIISPALALALFDGLAPSPGVAPSAVIEDFVDISADVEFKGEYSATRAPFTTGVLTFPIRAYRSNPVACANGFVKYFDNSTQMVDACTYVGQTISQLIAPPPPSACCPSLNSGPGC